MTPERSQIITYRVDVVIGRLQQHASVVVWQNIAVAVLRLVFLGNFSRALFGDLCIHDLQFLCVFVGVCVYFCVLIGYFLCLFNSLHVVSLLGVSSFFFWVPVRKSKSHIVFFLKATVTVIVAGFHAEKEDAATQI